MGKAQIRISPEIIIDALHMPAGTEIKDIIPGGYYGDDWVFVIDSPELPDDVPNVELKAIQPGRSRVSVYMVEEGEVIRIGGSLNDR